MRENEMAQVGSEQSVSAVSREPGDDMVINVRLRKTAYDALVDDGLEIVGIMKLVPNNGAWEILVWTSTMPEWPEPVPGNDNARRALESRS